ncbi:MAG: hypothetical protein ABI674_06705 [Spartobacteria bacterium]
MPPRKPANRIAPRVPPVKYFAIMHGAALMVGTDPGPGGDDFGRNWKQMTIAGRIIPAHDMAARYFLFGETGCEQIGVAAAAKMAAKFGGSLETLISGEQWRRTAPRPKAFAAKKTRAARETRIPARKTRRSLRPR